MEERVSTGEVLSEDPSIPARGTEVIPVILDDYTGPWLCYTNILTLNSLSILLALIGLAGNAIVLWLLGFRMRRNTFSVYTLSLAGADFLFLCFQILETMSYLSRSIHISVPKFFYVVTNFAYLAGLSMLCAISTERCLCVVGPIWYRCRRPRHTSTAVCVLLWAVSLVLSLLEGNGCGFLFRASYDDVCKTFDFIIAAWMMVLFVVLCGSTLVLLLKIFCGSRRMPVARLYVTLVLTVLVFLLLGLPFGIYWFLLVWFDSFDYVIPCDPHVVTVFLSCVNSCANPIIYFFVGSFRHRRFQCRSLQLILQRAMQDAPEEGECGDRGSSGNPRRLETFSFRC